MTTHRLVSGKDFDFSSAPLYRKTATLRKENIEIATEEVEVRTIINEVETTNVAVPGDYIVTGVRGERYVIKEAKFPKLYVESPDDSGLFISTNVRRVIQVTEPVELVAPWDELQRTDAGGFITQGYIADQHADDPNDVYLIEESVFYETYGLYDG